MTSDARLHEILLQALEQRHALLADVADARDDDDLNARVCRLLDCTPSEARIVMDIQLRRFSQESRRRIEEQAQQVFRLAGRDSNQ